jgi:hypothetical protein
MPTYIKETNEIIVAKGDYLRLGLKYYKYIGEVKTLDELPASDCLFSMCGFLYIRRIDYNRLQLMKSNMESVKEVDDSDELDLEVKPGDDATLIIIKELLKGFTKNSFRKLFDNDSDMNNMRRAIEKSPNGQLSLNRFRIILEKLGLKYKIIVYENEEEATKDEDNDNSEIIKKINDKNSNETDDDLSI